jgi:ribokinase
MPVAGETLCGTSASGPGGKGFNQAVASARAGARTRFVCALGADAGGQQARALAVAEGIDLRDAVSDAPTGTAGIFVDARGRNSIVVAAGANGELTAAHVAHGFATGDAPAVVLAQLETPPDAALAAFRAGRRTGALAMLNPAPADAPVDAGLLSQVDVLTPNETEFAALVARHLAAVPDAAGIAAMDDGSLHQLCRGLLPGGTVVVTLGGAGCFVSHAEGHRHGDTAACYRLPAPAVRVVDTTGAGDAFNGALAASLASSDQPFAAHLRFAVAYASLSTEAAGAALAMPRRHELDSRFPIG